MSALPTLRAARPRLFLTCALFLPSLVFALVACGSEAAPQTPVAARTAAAQSAGDPEVLAVLDGVPITVADLEEAVGGELASLDFQYGTSRYRLLDTGLQQVIRERVLAAEAAARGITSEELVDAEVGALEVSDAEVEAWYQQNQGRLQGRPLDALRPAIRDFLLESRRDEIVAGLTARLLETRELAVTLEPYRADIEIEGHPTVGPDSAPLTLVEFSDFECPYCGRFFETIERVRSEYGDQMRIVFRQFPLNQIHPNAQKAAEASLCAHEEGKFWELHDLMFTEQQTLKVEDLMEKAGRAGLDTNAFAACVASGRYADQVQADLEAGQRLGVDGTPALFLNGMPVPGGALPFDDLARVIDQELERIGAR